MPTTPHTPGRKRGGWNKGKGTGYIDPRGYRWIRREDGKDVREHRHVMAQSLSRELEPWEIVHHKDGNPLNNAPENLELMTYSKHNIEHNLGREVHRSDERARIHSMHCQMREEIKRLRGQKAEMLATIKGLLKSADAEWEEGDSGHDWNDACEAARALLAGLGGRLTV